MKTIFYLFITIFCLAITSCSSDDNGGKQDDVITSPIVGNWKRTYSDHGTVSVSFNLKSDGTYTEETDYTDLEGKTYKTSDHGTYSYDPESRFLTTVSNAGNRPWTYIVMNVSKTTLVLMFSDYSGSMTFTK